MAWRFNPPPGWPTPPAGWIPPADWRPDPSWPPAPPGWQFLVAEPDAGAGQPRRGRAGPIVAVVAVGAVLGVAALVLLGVMVAQRVGGDTEAQVLETQSEASSVRVDNECGPIAVRPGPPGVVRTEARVTSWWRTPQLTSRDEHGAVAIDVECGSFGGIVRLVVQVPADAAVEARSSAGGVEANGLTGALDLHSSAGSVNGSDLRSTDVEAETSAGSVELSWAAGADVQRVDASSSAGSVTVLLPDRPSVAYRVDADSSAGSTSVQVRTDPSATRTVRAQSSAGSVTVGYR